MIKSPIFWNKAAFPAQAGRPVAIARDEFQACCCAPAEDPYHYRCDPNGHVCSQTLDPVGDDVYASLAECMAACGAVPCLTSGCDFDIQFYYLSSWGDHFCDRALFNAYAGARLLGEVDLNNGEDGGSRFSAFFPVTAADFLADTCSYTFSLVCQLTSCHRGISGLKFVSGGETILDLPRQSGDRWGVSANDICNPAP